MPRRLEEIFSCDYDSRVWLWSHGNVPRDKMRGRALSARNTFDAEIDVEQILRGKVVHGWIVTIDGEGDWSGCGSDWVTYFEKEKPDVVDGKWAGHPVENEELDDEVPATVIEGPYEATWLEIS